MPIALSNLPPQCKSPPALDSYNQTLYTPPTSLTLTSFSHRRLHHHHPGSSPSSSQPRPATPPANPSPPSALSTVSYPPPPYSCPDYTVPTTSYALAALLDTVRIGPPPRAGALFVLRPLLKGARNLVLQMCLRITMQVQCQMVAMGLGPGWTEVQRVDVGCVVGGVMVGGDLLVSGWGVRGGSVGRDCVCGRVLWSTFLGVCCRILLCRARDCVVLTFEGEIVTSGRLGAIDLTI